MNITKPKSKQPKPKHKLPQNSQQTFFQDHLRGIGFRSRGYNLEVQLAFQIEDT